MSVESGRELYARVGLSQIPHILGLVDRNLLSPTYGCFDRSYWHYKTAPFPSGMYQEFVLPLALVYRHPFPGGEAFHGQTRLLELAVAGMRFAARSSHGDGSCDDYFPFEKALGAAAFSLYACTEAYILLEVEDPGLIAFFRKRADWLKGRQEAGRLSNHHALVVLALHNLYRITGDPAYADAARERLGMLLGWQHPEGWFPEYEGCDPGYLTATIDFLAKYYRNSGDERVLEPLKRAVLFACRFLHPDGSYGGEYGSRNTALFFPHGFELMAAHLPEAAAAADLYLKGIRRDRRVHLDDDRLCAHLTYDHLQAYLDFGPRHGSPQGLRRERRYWKGARLYVHRDERRHAVVAANKGGSLRLYQDGELLCSDSGLIVRLADGTVLVSHLVDNYEVQLLEEGLCIQGRMGVCRFALPTPAKQAVFHVGMITLGRLGSNLVRRILQRLLIVGKRPGPIRFQRTLLMGDRIQLIDELWHLRNNRPRLRVVELYAGTDHTSIYVAVSNSYQWACLQPWTDFRDRVEELNTKGYLRLEREFP
jgi:hypothetical protein